MEKTLEQAVKELNVLKRTLGVTHPDNKAPLLEAKEKLEEEVSRLSFEKKLQKLAKFELNETENKEFKMKLTEIKNYIENFTFYGGVEKGENMQLRNTAYFLVKNYRFSKSYKDITENDLDMLLDNLYINNELITEETINDYVGGFIESLNLRQKTINEIKSGQKFMLLNYYNIDNKLTPCKIMLDTNFNVFE